MYAISSAGVVYAITRACSQGDLKVCSCDPLKRGRSKDERGEFDWGGCSDNINYGIRFAKAFVDAKEKKVKDARALMNLHNNRCGRMVSAAPAAEPSTRPSHWDPPYGTGQPEQPGQRNGTLGIFGGQLLLWIRLDAALPSHCSPARFALGNGPTGMAGPRSPLPPVSSLMLASVTSLHSPRLPLGAPSHTAKG